MGTSDAMQTRIEHSIWNPKSWSQVSPVVSITPHEFRTFRYSLMAVVCLSVASTCIENGLHPLLLITLPVIAAALSRSDYSRPYLWSERITTAVFGVYSAAVFLAVIFLLRRIPLPMLLVYFTFGTVLARVLCPLTDRHIAQLIFLSAGLILINCILTNHLVFGLMLPLYVYALMVTLVLFDIARSRRAASEATGESLPEPSYPGLVRYFGRIAAGMVVVTAAVFVLLPRPFLVLPGLRAAMARPDGMGEMQQRISYREMVGMGARDRIAFVVDVDEGKLPESPYWRGKVLEDFDGKGWVTAPERGGLPRFTLPLPSETVVYRFSPYKLQSNTVYVCGLPFTVTPGTSHRSLYISSNGEAVVDSPFLVATSYTVTSVNRPIPAYRRQAGANLSSAGITPGIEKLAKEWSQGVASPADKAKAIMDRFTSRFRYALDAPPPPEGTNPLEYFLLQSRAGHCEYFAGAFCLMLRSLGIPARVVEGFSGMESTPVPSQFVVRFGQAHAWVEAVLGDNNWTTLDPTPPAADQVAGRYWRAVMDVYDRWVRRWIKYVVYFDRTDQAALLDMASGVLTGDVSLPDSSGTAAGYLLYGIALGAVVLITVFLVLYRFRRAGKDVSGMYLKTMEELVERGVLTQAHPWHERNLEEIAQKAPNLREAAERFTDVYLGARFGGNGQAAAAALAAARAELLRSVDQSKTLADAA